MALLKNLRVLAGLGLQDCLVKFIICSSLYLSI